MVQYRWSNAPIEIAEQVNGVVAGCQQILGEQLVGVYLHGSLAMGCFNPSMSDLDLLVVAADALTDDARHGFGELLLAVSLQPSPVEISVLSAPQIRQARHPFPYQYHYSEAWRERQTAELMQPSHLPHDALSDPDLAAHFVITRERGVLLYGTPIRDTLPEVPTDDYVDALLYNFDDAIDHITDNPVYAILTLCRVYWYLLKSAIASKDEAGVWAMSYLPEDYQGVATRALRVYRGSAKPVFDEGELKDFAAYLRNEVRGLLA